MASLDSLPADQRAVLQLVLKRRRSYDEIAQMLSIDRAAVRERALSALDALGPQTRVAPERRALITDYLLGQLPARVSEDTRERLAESPSDRAWARVVASELGSLASGPLPEIPVESLRPRATQPAQPIAVEPAQPFAAEPAEPFEARPEREPPARAEPVPSLPPEPSRAPVQSGVPGDEPPRRSFHRRARPPRPKAPPTPGTRRSSRLGGTVVLALGMLVVVIVVVVILVVSGGSSNKPAGVSTQTAASTPAPTSTTATTAAKPIAQVNLVSPTGSKKTAGIAEIIKQGVNTGLVVVAQGVPANTSHDAYAVWLYNSPSDTHILGFVNPGVKADGKLQTAGALPANAAHFKQLLVTLETQAKPHGPGKIVLEGPLKITQ